MKTFEGLWAELSEKAQTRPEGSGTVRQLDAGIPASVAWFLEHRAAHPEEDRLVESEGAGAGWKTLATEPA